MQYLKGVGPRLGQVFASRGIHTVRDLLYFLPRAYEDRSTLSPVAMLKDGDRATVAVQIHTTKRISLRKSGKSIFEVRARDTSGVISLRWFHTPQGLEARFRSGAQILASGEIKFYLGQPQMVHPEITWSVSSDAAEIHAGRVVPIYTEIEGVPSRTLRRLLYECLEQYGALLKDDLPETLLKRHQLPPIAGALRAIHFPEGHSQALLDFGTPAHARLIYDEFFKFEYWVLKRRLARSHEPAWSLSVPEQQLAERALADLKRALPFELTGGQNQALADVLGDFARARPMNRLIQGDVGSGKTAVALLSAGVVLALGGQATLMAPTEILAEQHYRGALKLFGTRLRLALVTGQTPESERMRLASELKQGQPILVIGTHALIEDWLEFRALNLILIDEQHRFGVEQRRTLRNKGVRRVPGQTRPLQPHTLVLTATPIPRTLALTAYGDLQVSSIRELPPGRSPILTRVYEGAGRAQAFERIRDELKRGHQAYVIYPLVDDSEAEGFTDLKSATQEAERLSREVFAEYRVGLLHGQMSAEQKEAVMAQFKAGELHVLVSTTVVEVGVDVPNATAIAIEHAERFGLSQLHQLRGRVGRGRAQSYCFLLTPGRPGERTQARLDALEESNDGFLLAEVDLELRGPGEFLGTRQSGDLPFRMANLIRDRDWLERARQDVIELLQVDPDCLSAELAPFRRYLEREGRIQQDRLRTS